MSATLIQPFQYALWAASLAIVPADVALAATGEPGISGQLAARVEIAPQWQLAPRLPADELPAFHCDATYCGFDALRDSWKQNLHRPPPLDIGNADSIIVARARFIAEGQRWAGAPSLFQVTIPGTNCSFGGSDHGLGFHCGSAHHDKDSRFVCADRPTCTPTETLAP